jgi:hypothetical protein
MLLITKYHSPEMPQEHPQGSGRHSCKQSSSAMWNFKQIVAVFGLLNTFPRFGEAQREKVTFFATHVQAMFLQDHYTGRLNYLCSK